MLIKMLTKVFGSRNDRTLRRMRKVVNIINGMEPAMEKLSDDELKAKTTEFRARLEKGETLESLIPEAFAVVREASKRVFGMRHFDVQLLGGMVLNDRCIAEMRTGEGKTLTATLPAYLNALTGKGVHVVTVNDYLARRDSEWMGPLYQFHGLSVDCIDKHKPNSAARRKAYMADITFGTNNEYGFDYLRDNMSISPDDLVQRKHHFAIVDEVDSVLIDDARTPLIISGPVPKGDDQMFEQYRGAVENLFNLQRNLVTQLLADAKRLIAEGKTEEGSVLLYRAHKGLPKYKPLIKFLSEPGIKAMMLKTENIYMQDNNRRMPEIVDDLYFVIDEKLNSVELQDKGHEALSKSVGEDGFFVLPDIGSSIADIEKENISAEEKAAKKDAILNDYAIRSERVHTVNQLLKAYSMFEKCRSAHNGCRNAPFE